MKKHFKILIYTLLYSTHALSMDYLPTLNRHTAYTEQDWGDLEVWAQFDFLALPDKSIEHHTNYLGGFNVGLYKGISFHYHFLHSDQLILQSQEPLKIPVKHNGHDIRLAYLWQFKPSWALNLEMGTRFHKLIPLNTKKYQAGEILIRSSDNSDVLTVNASDISFVFGSNLIKSFSDDFQLSLGLEGRLTEINANFSSPILNDPTIAHIFKHDIPQNTPWKEQNLIIKASMEWHIWKPISMAIDFKHYQVWRANYENNTDKLDYSNGQRLDIYLFANLYKGLTLYTHSQFMTNYFLVDEPLLYNKATNHLFNRYYGFFSAGISYNF